MLSAERLRSVLDYSPETGVFLWKIRCGTKYPVGSIAGSKERAGYIKIGVDRRVYKAHRLAYLYMTGGWPKEDIDHINEIKDDNRWLNLRNANDSQNKANTRKYRRRKYDLPKGVDFRPDKKSKPYVARVRVRGKIIHLGYYASPEEAHSVYCIGAQRYHGDFAKW